uniref:Putative RNA-directed RNA polymerase n=1 Tax=Ceratitis capitata TaxID=7213 RepID=W8AKC2_CERCA
MRRPQQHLEHRAREVLTMYMARSSHIHRHLRDRKKLHADACSDSVWGLCNRGSGGGGGGRGRSPARSSSQRHIQEQRTESAEGPNQGGTTPGSTKTPTTAQPSPTCRRCRRIGSYPEQQLYGHWTVPRGSPRSLVPKYTLPMVSTQLPGPINGTPYHVHISDSFYSEITFPRELMSRPLDVEKLRRYWGTTPLWWPVSNNTDCGWPLYLYYKILQDAGQRQIAQEIYYILDRVRAMWNKERRTQAYLSGSESDKYEDDFFRHALKQLSSHCYPLIFTKGPAYMLFCHLHALNAKAPFTKDQIIRDIDAWTSDTLDGKPKHIDMDTFNKTLDQVFSQWGTYPLSESHTYEEFANDPLRWGTSGGAPPVVLFGDKVKSKWAWAISHMFRDEEMKADPNLARAAKQATSTAKVALKEETQKTREIITTPIDSYLRQTYLLYRRKKIPIPSPISSPDWLPTMEGTNYRWYGCIDGERFDHSVPKEAMIALVNKLGDLDEETRRVADEEIEHLEGLSIEWMNKKWRYEGGVLSGWRFTSLLGSLVSLAAANYIIDKTGTKGALDVGVMGDDIVLMSHSRNIPSATAVDLYNQFGLKANLKKTVSGPQGEFLRKVRSSGGSWAFPALDLKTITHAAPWIENFQFRFEEECANAWHVLISRMLPHATHPAKLQAKINEYTIKDLNQRFGRSMPWSDWLATPMSAGGGGYVENSDVSRWCVIEKMAPTENMRPFERLCQMLGTLPSKRVLKKFTMTSIPVSTIIKKLPYISANTADSYVPRFKRNANSTRLTWAMLKRSITPSQLNKYLETPIPHRMRMLKIDKIASLMTSGKKQMDSIPTIVHTKEAFPTASYILSSVTKQLMARRSNIPFSQIKPMATLFAMTKYKDVPLPYGTW